MVEVSKSRFASAAKSGKTVGKAVSAQDTEATERLKRSVAACLRAVGGRRDLLVTYTPLAYAQGGAIAGQQARLPLPATKVDAEALSRLRGTADALGLRLRHHDSRLHQKRMPQQDEAREIYNALEQVRVESLGAQRLPGAGQNIAEAVNLRYAAESYDQLREATAVPLADILRMAAYRRFGSVPVGPVGRHLLDIGGDKVAAVEAFLQQMEGCLENQEAFARATRQMLAALNLELPEPPESETEEEEQSDENADSQSRPEESPENKPQESDGKGEQGTDEQSASAPATPDEQSGEGESSPDDDTMAVPGGDSEDPAGDQQAMQPRQGHNSGFATDYQIYTGEFDQESEADQLCDPEELTRLRFTLDQQLGHLQGVVSRLANRLQRRLMAQQRRSWDFDLEEGILDAARLARIVANPTHSLSYKWEKETEFRDTVVTLLIDNSGSMRGRPISVAAMTADILARTLERCSVKVEILGFTTSQWKGGKAREKWLREGKPAHPGRLNDLRHIIYKGADMPWRRVRRNLGLMLKEGILKENIDGEALLWAHRRLLGRPEQRRILMVVSDGAPVDDSTLSVNHSNYLEQHLREVIGWIETRSPVRLMAIGIGHDVTRYYRRAVTIMDAEELGGTVLRQLAEMFDEDVQSWR